MTSFSCAKLSDRGVLAVAGPDRVAFLQNLITQDLGLLTAARPLYGLLLNAQGRFLHEFFIYQVGEEILLETAAQGVRDLADRLNRYRLRSKVSIDDRSPDVAVFAVWGKDSQNNGIEGAERAVGLLPDARTPALGWRGLADTPLPENASVAEYRNWCLGQGVPGGCDLVAEQSLPAEFNLDLLGGISFTKGCYVGQEVTARQHFRALLKRRACLVRGETLPAAREPLVAADGQPIGDLVARAPGGGLCLMALDRIAELSFRPAPLPEGFVARAELATKDGAVEILLPVWQRSLLSPALLAKL